MQKVIRFLKKNNKGYVSIELIVIGGLVVGLGAVLIGSFNNAGTLQVNNSLKTVDGSFDMPLSNQK